MNKKLQDEIRNTEIQYSGTKFSDESKFNIFQYFNISEPNTEVDEKELFKSLIPG